LALALADCVEKGDANEFSLLVEYRLRGHLWLLSGYLFVRFEATLRDRTTNRFLSNKQGPLNQAHNNTYKRSSTPANEVVNPPLSARV
jgi:hypothetical protein